MDWKKQLEQIKTNLPHEKIKWIDSHAHYYVRQFNKDRDKLLKKLNDTELELIINCGTNTQSNQQVIELSNKYDFCYSIIGFFPCDVLEMDNEENIKTLKKQIKENKKVIGLGEIGLDYHWNKPSPDIQKARFIEQINIARELNVPICIHSRDAEQDTLDILKKYASDLSVAIHCYSNGVKTAKEYIEMGYYFGVGGTSTYKSNNELREAIKIIPIEQIILETDCPYLTPEPYRRERNDSSYIKYVIENIANIKQLSTNEVIQITNNNVKKLYRI